MRNVVYAVLFAILLSPVFLLADAMGVALRHPQVRRILGLVKSTQAVYTISYTPLRSGATTSSLSASNFSPLLARALPNSENATAAMPLYLSTHHHPVRGLPSKSRVIFFGTKDSNFVAYDLDKEQRIWSLPLSSGLLVRNTAVMDVDNGLIYFLAEVREQSGKRRQSSRLYAVSFDGHEISSREIPFACRTALGLRQEKSPAVVLGCREEIPQVKSRVAKTRELWVFVPLNKNGGLEEAELDIAPFAGVPPMGMTAPILPNGALLVAARQENNSDQNVEGPSCCIKRIQGDDQKIYSEVPYLCVPAKGPNCFQPTVYQDGQRLFGFFPGEDGAILSFDAKAPPKHLSTAKPAMDLDLPPRQPISAYSDEPGNSRIFTVEGISGSGVAIIRAFRVGMNLALHPLWSYPVADRHSGSPGRPLIIQNSESNEAILLLLRQELTSSFSHLLLLDANRGTPLEDIRFDGALGNSIPLVIDEEIYIATATNGIVRFGRSGSLAAIFRESSYFRGFWKIFFKPIAVSVPSPA